VALPKLNGNITKKPVKRAVRWCMPSQSDQMSGIYGAVLPAKSNVFGKDNLIL
jgi:hypothetical protein